MKELLIVILLVILVFFIWLAVQLINYDEEKEKADRIEVLSPEEIGIDKKWKTK